ncbi:FTR1 family iron permease [Marinicrinis sediminis]|uniref:FTR1 family protein n=1 Tax=Marinicrinis sediminis TaxID=1652465 RepID=A0ABW5RAM5_9BACL
MAFSHFSAFLITFREALEALLIVGIIMTYLNRVGAKKWNKWVLVGVFLAVLTAILVAFLFQIVFVGYGGLKSSIYLRFGVLFVSVFLLTHMVLWMVGQRKDQKKSMEAKLAQILTTGSIANMIIHSYLVVMREGVETVFFFAAISNGDITKAFLSWGAWLGLLSAVTISLLFFKSARRISISSFFKLTSIFIVFIAAGLLSNTVGMMQDMGYMKSVHMTPGGQVGELYDLKGFMPEHPDDEAHYARDTGNDTVISGQVGIFFSAMFGYTHNPSVEQFVFYWGYYLFAFLLAGWYARRKGRSATQTDQPSVKPSVTTQPATKPSV